MARLTKLYFDNEEPAFYQVRRLEPLFGLTRDAIAKHGLFAHQLLHQRLPLVVLVRRNCRGSANDEWRARFVDQDGIDFIDNGVVVAALHLLLARRRHSVVAQIIETELGVCAVGNVAGVLLAANAWFLIMLNTTDREAKKAIKLPHPLSVTSCQIIVHRDQMSAAAGQCV